MPQNAKIQPMSQIYNKHQNNYMYVRLASNIILFYFIKNNPGMSKHNPD